MRPILQSGIEERRINEEAMPLSGLAVQDLYTKRIDRYSSFINVFQSPQGIQALLRFNRATYAVEARSATEATTGA